MPTYQYACTECDEQLEVRQSFTDDALSVCPSCEGRLRKVFNAVGVVFKGSGFYKTDSRKQPSGESASTDTGSDAGSGKDSGSGSGSGKDSAGTGKDSAGSGKDSAAKSGSGTSGGSGGSAKSSAA